jgi:hypothetical protein
MEHRRKTYHTHRAREQFHVDASSDAGPDVIKKISVEEGTPLGFHIVNEGWARLRIQEIVVCVRFQELQRILPFLESWQETVPAKGSSVLRSPKDVSFGIDVSLEHGELKTRDTILPAGTVFQDVQHVNGKVYGIMQRPAMHPHSFCMVATQFNELPFVSSLQSRNSESDSQQ